MRGHYFKNTCLSVDSSKSDCTAADQQMQRVLADKITNFASTDELRLLLVSGAKADGAVNLGLRPLHYAVYCNHFDAAKLLLVRGAKADRVDDIGYSPLHLCAEKGNLRMLKLLLEHLVNRVRSPSFDLTKDQAYPIRDGADEPLRLAILQKHFECARLLLEHGANPNARYFAGPQITLPEPQERAFIRLLLDFDANPDVPARNGMTILMKACELGEPAYKTAELLVERGADLNAINFKTTYPMSCLHYAVGSSYLPMVKLLLEHGAQVNIRDRVMGRTKNGSFPSVLHFAIMSGDFEMVTLMLKYGADINAADSVYGNALHLAACYRIGSANQVEMVQLLLSRGANPNADVVNSHGVRLRCPVVEFFRRLYKFTLESDEPTEWMRIAELLFAHGARFVLTPENVDVSGMNVPRNAKAPPDYASDLTYFVLQMALGIENADSIEEENSIYASRAQIHAFNTNPRQLAQIARNTLRSHLSMCPETVERLPLSYFDKNYLLGTTELPVY